MADLSHPNNSFVPGGDEDHLSRLLLTQNDEPFYKSLYRNIKEAINPPKLPPLELTSKPVAVKDIWGLYGNQKKSFMMSFGFQICLVLFVVLALSTKPVQKAVTQVAALILPADVPVDIKPFKGGGGGGDRSPLQASKGKLPKPQLRQFVPPSAVINNPTWILPFWLLRMRTCRKSTCRIMAIRWGNWDRPRTVRAPAAASAPVRVAAWAPATAAALAPVQAVDSATVFTAQAMASRSRS
jgi:hypothetical protein